MVGCHPRGGLLCLNRFPQSQSEASDPMRAQVCVHMCVCMSVCASVCKCTQKCVQVCQKLSAGWAGCTEWPETHSSLIMPDRLIRGESCCVSIATDRVSVSPLNLSLHTGRKGVQARTEEEGPGREGKEVLGEAEAAGVSTAGPHREPGEQDLQSSGKYLQDK